MKNKRVGITGSRGFVGQALIEDLTQRGAIALRLYRSEHVGNYYLIDQNTHSIIETEALKNIDCVVHCGARVHTKTFSFTNKRKYYEDNVLNTIGLAKRAHESGVKRFIFISTVKVNGEQTVIGHPFSLRDIPNPRDHYAISKYQAELELIELAKKSEMDIIILRVPLIYGRKSKANFRNLINLVSKGIPLPFKGRNKNLRSFLYIENLTDLIIKCIASDIKLNDIFYVSDNDDASIERLIILINEATGASSKLFFVPPIFFHIINRIPYIGNLISKLTNSLQIDVSETLRKLNWRPVVNLQEGLLRSIKKSE